MKNNDYKLRQMKNEIKIQKLVILRDLNLLLQLFFLSLHPLTASLQFLYFCN